MTDERRRDSKIRQIFECLLIIPLLKVIIFSAKMAEGQEEQKKITITVKTTKEKHQVEVEEDSDIKKVTGMHDRRNLFMA